MRNLLLLPILLVLLATSACKKDRDENTLRDTPVLDTRNSFQVPLFFGTEPLAQLSVTQELYDRYSSSNAVSKVKAVLRNNQNFRIDSLTYKVYVYSTINASKAQPIYISTFTSSAITANSQGDSITLDIPFTQDLSAPLFRIEVITLSLNGQNVSSPYSGVYYGSYDIYKTNAPDTVPTISSKNFVNATIDAAGTLRTLLTTTNWERINGYIDPTGNFTGSYYYADSLVTGLRKERLVVTANRTDLTFKSTTQPFTLFDSLVIHLNK